MGSINKVKNRGGIDCDFAIIGAGALGSILGAHLQNAGSKVLMLARGNRFVQAQSQGLHITGLREIIERVPIIEDPIQLTSARTLIVATKAIDTQKAVSKLRHAKIGSAFSVQNGIKKDKILENIVGKKRTLGAVADFSGEFGPSGNIEFTRNEGLFIGGFDCCSNSRASRIAHIINNSGINATNVEDIRVLEWSKFAAWAGFMAMAVITRTETWKILSDTNASVMIAKIIRELGILAKSEGVNLSNRAILPVRSICNSTDEEIIPLIQKFGKVYATSAPSHKVSALQDVEAGRPLELEETLGYALRIAETRNVDMPTLRVVYALIASIDRTRKLV